MFRARAAEERGPVVLISVIIPTYNRVDDLKQIIGMLTHQKREDWFRYEVIIVDNNSSDSTAEYLKSFGSDQSVIRTLKEMKQGTGHALNAGIKVARGEIIVFGSDDLLIHEDRLLKIAKIFRDQPNLECATGKVLPVWNCEKPVWYSDELKGVLVHVDYGESRTKVNYCVGANSCFRKSVFERFGLFGTDWRFEDVHFARRIRDKVDINYFPELVVYHPVHTERMTQKYFKRWFSLAGAFEGHDVPLKGRNLFKLELWRYRDALRHALGYLRHFNVASKRFCHQCQLIFLISMFQERNGIFKP